MNKSMYRDDRAIMGQTQSEPRCGGNRIPALDTFNLSRRLSMPERHPTKYKQRAPVRPEQEAPDGARTIPLTRGWVAWVDEADYERLRGRWWQAAVRKGGGVVYASHGAKVGGRSVTTYMHREIVGGVHVDHREHRSEIQVVDNRRCNLRSATASENNHNRRKTSSRATSSRFKGVYREGSRWRAHIRYGGPPRGLGCFATEHEAARAYDAEARRLFGEFAQTNFRDEQDSPAE